MHRNLLASLAIVSLAIAVGACSGRRPAPSVSPQAPPPAVQAPPPAPAPPPAAAAAPAPSRPETEDEAFARKSLAELNAERPLGDVFFDYESAILRPADIAALQRNATWMKRWPSTQAIIQGHCDERGTAEYNIALGERRAAAARDYLVSLGVEPTRVAVVSKGKEQPFCQDAQEACWQQNRRGHFILTAK